MQSTGMPISTMVESPEALASDSSSDGELITIKFSCNQVRSKLEAFVNSGTMKVGELQDKIDVSSKSYLSFMRQSGPHAGSQSDTYIKAHRFLARWEAQGKKIPRAKKAAASSGTASRGAGATDDKYNVDGIELDTNSNGRVPVYDTCDDVRRKIGAHLRATGQNKAAFARMISAAAGGETAPQGKQLTDFQRKKGAVAGNTSKVFYMAYVYFEKLRVKQKKAKSKKRQEMEAEYSSEGGVDTENLSMDGGGRMFMHVSESAYVDGLGRTHLTSAGGRDRILT